ncbi:MAG: class I SAM-dependent methyltransferase [Patescibacteria group bacterium]
MIDEDRVQREKDAYNDPDGFLKNSIALQSRFSHVFKSPNSVRMETDLEAMMGKVEGKVVLDYGCYSGGVSLVLSDNGAKRVVGIDISERGVKQAKKKNIKHAEFHVMDAHKTTFDDNTFDYIFGRSILHHLDWEIALKEIERILKPGGIAVFTEPLNINPFAKLLRAITKSARTHDELALQLWHLRTASQIFPGSKNSYYNLLTVPVGMLSSKLSKNPNNVVMRTVDVVDRLLLKTPLKYWSRVTLVRWQKKTKD